MEENDHAAPAKPAHRSRFHADHAGGNSWRIQQAYLSGLVARSLERSIRARGARDSVPGRGYATGPTTVPRADFRASSGNLARAARNGSKAMSRANAGRAVHGARSLAPDG